MMLVPPALRDGLLLRWLADWTLWAFVFATAWCIARGLIGRIRWWDVVIGVVVGTVAGAIVLTKDYREGRWP